MTKQELNKKLKKCGFSDKTIKNILKDAENSSNPEFIYHYWGVKI